MRSFPIDSCPGAARIVANLIDSGPLGPSNPNFTARVGGDAATAQDLFNRLEHFGWNDQTSSNATAAPPCANQGAQSSIGQIPEMTDYLHVYSSP